MNESYHNQLATGVEKQYRQLEQDIMDDIVRRIKKAGTITDTADWQIQRLVILGNSSQDVENLIRKAVDGNEEEVRRLYAEVIEQEYTRDKDLYEKVGKEFIPYEQNPELQQITNALVNQSNEDLYNITQSMGFMLNNGQGGKVYTPLSDMYNRYLDQAITGMANGAYDYNTLIRRMVNQMTASGLRTDHAFSDGSNDYGIDYASGWHNRIDVAARRALLTGFGQLTGRITDMNAQRLGTQYFEVTWHAGARPDHAVWQGKVYTKGELVSKCGLGTGWGLHGWNCRHDYYPFIPGISQRNYTDEWLAEQNAKEAISKTFRGKEYTTYQATQKQRQMETAMRAQRERVQLLRDGGADPEDITIARCKYQAQLDEYKKFSQTMGLPEQMERVYTGRTSGRIAPSPKTYAKWQAERENKHTQWLKEIGATSTTLNTLDKYEVAKHNKTEEYRLLRGYSKAVEKGDIYALTGFDLYKKTASEIQERIVGQTTVDGVKIESFATHFIDRVIGQTSEPHQGMREGVAIEKVLETLQSEIALTKTMANGDVRRTYTSAEANVTISVRGQRMIQTNPRRKKNEH